MGIRIGLQYIRVLRKCDEYVNVNSLIDFLKTSKEYMVSPDVTRKIIIEGIPSTFDAVPEGSFRSAALAICDRNPLELLEVIGVSRSPSSVSTHGREGFCSCNSFSCRRC